MEGHLFGAMHSRCFVVQVRGMLYWSKEIEY